MEFFDFYNTQSFQFFQWLRQNADTEALVKEAFDEIEAEPWDEMGQDMSTVVRGQLQQILEDIFGELKDEWLESHNLAMDPEIADKPADVLFLGLLDEGCDIAFSNVAEAILRDHHKWAPDTDLPGVE